ncbi:ABC transporter ATP-binding protein [Pseudorhizobium endolithicum]|uniref:ABC transporter ATP-binding protein n=1 Tax=Pseudorhizobium endolithicum TaxID=1191678 RepID=A0ABM8PKX6_9HYPH|nr:ABC transporter ATP-binding protein [Pseudorhizobium endolithicum]CAD7035642.1 ABC transporter ATP-binding protein [Pseudorhizobium endolithicum]
MTFLELNGLRKHYHSVRAVSEVSLSAERGEFISLLGPSGCGKTTTLQMIAGFVEPSSGSIWLDGQPLTTVKPQNRGLGVVFQSYALFPHMTVAENVGFGLDMRKIREPERGRRVRDVLELVQLEQHRDRLPAQLSGGQQQRVALARALVIAPPLLLLDEPLSNLDAKLRAEMQLELRRIQRSFGTTTVMVTHDQDEAMALSDRIAVMDSGRIVQLGRPQDVYERPATAFVASFLGSTNLICGQLRLSAAGMQLVVSDRVALPCPDSTGRAGETAWFSIRPEKIRLVGDGSGETGHLKGKIVMRVFCGDRWIYELDTDVGRLVLRVQNQGHPADEGRTAGLTWNLGDMISVEGGHA